MIKDIARLFLVSIVLIIGYTVAAIQKHRSSTDYAVEQTKNDNQYNNFS